MRHPGSDACCELPCVAALPAVSNHSATSAATANPNPQPNPTPASPPPSQPPPPHAQPSLLTTILFLTFPPLPRAAADEVVWPALATAPSVVASLHAAAAPLLAQFASRGAAASALSEHAASVVDHNAGQPAVAQLGQVCGRKDKV